MLRNPVAAFVLLVVTLSGACALLSHEAPLEDVDKAGALFFLRLEKEDYGAIYNDAAKPLKQRKTKEVVTESLKELSAHGKVIDFQRIKMPFEGEGKDRIVSPIFKTTFEQVSGELTLNFRDESGEWKLIGFAFKPHGMKEG